MMDKDDKDQITDEPFQGTQELQFQDDLYASQEEGLDRSDQSPHLLLSDEEDEFPLPSPKRFCPLPDSEKNSSNELDKIPDKSPGTEFLADDKTKELSSIDDDSHETSAEKTANTVASIANALDVSRSNGEDDSKRSTEDDWSLQLTSGDVAQSVTSVEAGFSKTEEMMDVNANATDDDGLRKDGEQDLTLKHLENTGENSKALQEPIIENCDIITRDVPQESTKEAQDVGKEKSVAIMTESSDKLQGVSASVDVDGEKCDSVPVQDAQEETKEAGDVLVSSKTVLETVEESKNFKATIAINVVSCETEHIGKVGTEKRDSITADTLLDTERDSVDVSGDDSAVAKAVKEQSEVATHSESLQESVEETQILDPVPCKTEMNINKECSGENVASSADSGEEPHQGTSTEVSSCGDSVLSQKTEQNSDADVSALVSSVSDQINTSERNVAGEESVKEPEQNVANHVDEDINESENLMDSVPVSDVVATVEDVSQDDTGNSLDTSDEFKNGSPNEIDHKLEEEAGTSESREEPVAVTVQCEANDSERISQESVNITNTDDVAVKEVNVNEGENLDTMDMGLETGALVLTETESSLITDTPSISCEAKVNGSTADVEKAVADEPEPEKTNECIESEPGKMAECETEMPASPEIEKIECVAVVESGSEKADEFVAEMPSSPEIEKIECRATVKPEAKISSASEIEIPVESKASVVMDVGGENEVEPEGDGTIELKETIDLEPKVDGSEIVIADESEVRMEFETETDAVAEELQAGVQMELTPKLKAESVVEEATTENLSQDDSVVEIPVQDDTAGPSESHSKEEKGDIRVGSKGESESDVLPESLKLALSESEEVVMQVELNSEAETKTPAASTITADTAIVPEAEKPLVSETRRANEPDVDIQVDSKVQITAMEMEVETTSELDLSMPSGQNKEAASGESGGNLETTMRVDAESAPISKSPNQIQSIDVAEDTRNRTAETEPDLENSGTQIKDEPVIISLVDSCTNTSDTKEAESQSNKDIAVVDTEKDDLSTTESPCKSQSAEEGIEPEIVKESKVKENRSPADSEIPPQADASKVKSVSSENKEESTGLASLESKSSEQCSNGDASDKYHDSKIGSLVSPVPKEELHPGMVRFEIEKPPLLEVSAIDSSQETPRDQTFTHVCLRALANDESTLKSAVDDSKDSSLLETPEIERDSNNNDQNSDAEGVGGITDVCNTSTVSVERPSVSLEESSIAEQSLDEKSGHEKNVLAMEESMEMSDDGTLQISSVKKTTGRKRPVVDDEEIHFIPPSQPGNVSSPLHVSSSKRIEGSGKYMAESPCLEHYETPHKKVCVDRKTCTNSLETESKGVQVSFPALDDRLNASNSEKTNKVMVQIITVIQRIITKKVIKEGKIIRTLVIEEEDDPVVEEVPLDSISPHSSSSSRTTMSSLPGSLLSGELADVSSFTSKSTSSSSSGRKSATHSVSPPLSSCANATCSPPSCFPSIESEHSPYLPRSWTSTLSILSQATPKRGKKSIATVTKASDTDEAANKTPATDQSDDNTGFKLPNKVSKRSTTAAAAAMTQTKVGRKKKGVKFEKSQSPSNAAATKQQSHASKGKSPKHAETTKKKDVTLKLALSSSSSLLSASTPVSAVGEHDVQDAKSSLEMVSSSSVKPIAPPSQPPPLASSPPWKSPGDPLKSGVEMAVECEELDASISESSNSSSSKSILPGMRVMARWVDGCYYSGLVQSQTEDGRWLVVYDDHQTRAMSETDIIVIPLLEVGQNVLVPSASGFYDAGSITGRYRQGSEVGYVVLTEDGATKRFARSEVVLSSEQADAIVGNSRSRKSTAEVSLENIVEGKRRRAANFSPIGTRPVSETRKMRVKKKPDPNFDSTSTDDASADAAKEAPPAREMAPAVVEKPPKHEEKSSLRRVANSVASEPKTRSPKRKGDSSSSSHLCQTAEKSLGPLLPKGSTLFKDFACLLSYTEKRPEPPLKDANFSSLDCEAELGSAALVPFNKAHVKAQIESGSGTVLDKFEHTQTTQSKHVLLITGSHLRTLKYIQCLAAGIPCVSHQWVKDCISVNRIHNYTSYLLPAGYSIVSRSLIEWHSKNTVLQGMHVLLVSAANDQFIDTWTPVLLAAKADIVRRLPLQGSAASSYNVDIIVSDPSCPTQVLRRAANMGIPVVSSEWIIQCLITGQRLKPDAHPKFRHSFKE